MIERGEKRRTGNIALEVNKKNARVEETKGTRGKIEAISK